MNDDGMGERKTSWDKRHAPCSRVGTTVVRYYVLLRTRGTWYVQVQRHTRKLTDHSHQGNNQLVVSRMEPVD
jgi:hypothetical protein